jgi:hypothetical protein
VLRPATPYVAEFTRPRRRPSVGSSRHSLFWLRRRLRPVEQRHGDAGFHPRRRPDRCRGSGFCSGIAAYRIRWVERALAPVLDLMQTMPVFAYLVPILFSSASAPRRPSSARSSMRMPPMVAHHHSLSLRRVALRDPRPRPHDRLLAPPDDLAVMVPFRAGRADGRLNQVIMLSLNMVIIASMIGAGGLGFDVLAALRRLDIGAGLEAGFAIVALAIALDRLSQALPGRRDNRSRPMARQDGCGHPIWPAVSACLPPVLPRACSFRHWRAIPSNWSCRRVFSGTMSFSGSTSTSSTRSRRSGRPCSSTCWCR